MSNLNLTPDRLKNLYPAMPDSTRMRLHTQLRNLKNSPQEVKRAPRITRKVAIVIAIMALLMGTALAEVTTGVVSATIRQVIHAIRRTDDAAVIQVLPADQRDGPIASIDLFETNIHLAHVQADSRYVYVEALSRMKPDSGMMFHSDHVHVPGPDLIPGNEKLSQVVSFADGYPILPYVLAEVQVGGGSPTAWLPDELVRRRFVSRLYSEIDGAEYTSFSPTYALGTHVNRDASAYTYLSQAHTSTTRELPVTVSFTAGAYGENIPGYQTQIDPSMPTQEQLDALTDPYDMLFKLADPTPYTQSERKVLRLTVPVQADTRPPITLSQPDRSYPVISVTFTFTPLATYYDIKIDQSSYGVMLGWLQDLYFTDMQGKRLPEGPLRVHSYDAHELDVVTGSLQPGNLPRQMRLHLPWYYDRLPDEMYEDEAYASMWGEQQTVIPLTLPE